MGLTKSIDIKFINLKRKVNILVFKEKWCVRLDTTDIIRGGWIWKKKK